MRFAPQCSTASASATGARSSDRFTARSITCSGQTACGSGASPGRRAHVPRMRLIVDLGQILEVEMRINLRAGDARVAEHFLNCAQITRRLKQMRSERMAQHVRVHVAPETALDCPVRETLFDRTRRDAAPG